MGFCDGCMQLKGEAKSYDIKVLMHEVLSIQKSLARFMVEVDGRLSGLDSVYRSEGSPERDQSLFSLRSLSRGNSAEEANDATVFPCHVVAADRTFSKYSEV